MKWELTRQNILSIIRTTTVGTGVSLADIMTSNHINPYTSSSSTEDQLIGYNNNFKDISMTEMDISSELDISANATKRHQDFIAFLQHNNKYLEEVRVYTSFLCILLLTILHMLLLC